MSISRLILENQFGEESINAMRGTVLPLVPLSQIVLLAGATAPVNGGSGTGVGVADKGSMYIAKDTGAIYSQTGLISSPTWVILDAGGAAVLATLLAGFSAGAGVVAASDNILQGFNKLVGNQNRLQNGIFTPTVQTLSGSGIIDTTSMLTIVNNSTGSAFTMTLNAPTNQDGQLKLIKLNQDTSGFHMFMNSIAVPGIYTPTGTNTLTFTTAGDSVILIAMGIKWVILGGNAVAS